MHAFDKCVLSGVIYFLKNKWIYSQVYLVVVAVYLLFYFHRGNRVLGCSCVPSPVDGLLL